ncbi:hypothetical protein [Thalassobacterium maritimum]|uniref:hypothetical protein n=1 Tax=Thalassobacterium maritimum TaxID=3041265 RepID=UPI002810A3E7|nr:hypothetical protein [Coraliomargarita sp. SDUM461003]
MKGTDTPMECTGNAQHVENTGMMMILRLSGALSSGKAMRTILAVAAGHALSATAEITTRWILRPNSKSSRSVSGSEMD